MEILKNHFEEEILKDKNKVLQISKDLAEFMIYKQPLIANIMINNSINLSKIIKGKYNPELIELNFMKYKILNELGDIDVMYTSINEAFILTLLNYKYTSEEMLKVFNHYRKFSLRIEEFGEHEIYSHKMEEIIKKLELSNPNNFKLLFYYFDILNGLTSFTEDSYTIETLKKYYQMYEELKVINLYKNYIQNKIEDLEENFKIQFTKIKIKSFFRKETKENTIREMNILIDDIKQSKEQFNYLLIEPYIFICKIYVKNKDKEMLEKIIIENWCELIDKLYGDNQLLTANYTLLLLNNIVTKDKNFKQKLSGLINFVGENYSQVFNYSAQPTKLDYNFLHGEVCYLGAYVNMEDEEMIPWELIDMAALVYKNVLGINSEKYKKSLNLYKVIKKIHNLE